LGFILCCSVNPVAVEDHVVCYAAFVAHHHVINYARAGGPSELETDEAIVASSVGQDERPAVPCGGLNLRQNVVRGCTVEGGSPGQRRNPGVTRCNPRTLRRQAAVRCARPDNDPMGVVTSLSRDHEASGKGSPGLQSDRVSTFGSVQCLLEIPT